MRRDITAPLISNRSPEKATTLPNAIETVGPGASTTCVSFVNATGCPRNPTAGRLGITLSSFGAGAGLGGAGFGVRVCARINGINIEKIIWKIL